MNAISELQTFSTLGLQKSEDLSASSAGFLSDWTSRSNMLPDQDRLRQGI